MDREAREKPMRPPEKRRIQISYKSKRIEERLDIAPVLQIIRDFDVPKHKHLRSQYFHTLMVALENYVTMDNPSSIEYARETLSKLKKFIRLKRKKISRKHRVVSWMIQCRINFLVSLEKEKSLRMDTKYLREQELIVSKEHPRDYGLFVLWRSINVVINRLNELRFNVTLKNYVKSLFLRCSHFTWLSSSDKKLFNHMVFMMINNDGTYSVNETFLIDTERIFRDMWERFDRWKAFNPRQIMGLFEDIKMKELRKWIVDLTSKEFKDFIQREFRETIYDSHVCVSEKDRYEDEVKDFANPGAYGIIAKYRPHQIDALSKLLATEDYVDLILRTHDEWKNKHTVDLNYDILLRAVLRAYFDSNFAGAEDMDDYVITTSSGLSPDDIKESSQRVPLIVQIFHEYGIVYKGETVVYPDMGCCFLAWVKIMCEEDSIRGITPKGKCLIIPMYDRFFPESGGDIIRPEKQNVLDVDMPEGYEDIGGNPDEDGGSFC